MIDPSLVLASLGIELDRNNRARCPLHGGSNKTSFSVNFETGHWHCFSSGCHEGYSDMIGLVMLIRRCTFPEAVEYLASLMGISITGNYTNEVRTALRQKDTLNYIRREGKRSVEIDLCTILNIEDELQEWIKKRPSYFYDLGYTHEIQDYFEVGFYHDRYGIPRACFPIRDANGTVVATDGRRIDNNDEPRYCAEPPGFPKGTILYNYFRAKDYIVGFGGILFIVEGYKACWSMVQAGFMNTVACMGHGLVAEQPAIILGDINIKKAILILDGDAAGRNGARRSKQELGHLCETIIVDMEDEQDPSTLDTSELNKLLLPYLKM
jgi:DNA primase